MPKPLPSAQDLGVGNVQPSLAVATYKGATGGEDDAARGMYAAGGQFAAAAAHMEQAQEKYDNLQAEDRFNQYQERLNQIALDPQTGWKNAKGENALKGDFNKRYAEMFEDERKKLTDTLESPGAKRRFGQLSAAAAMRSRAALYEHSAQERVAYGAKVTSDSIKSIEASAWESYNDDNAFGALLARGEAIVKNFATEWNVGAGQESVQLAVRDFNSRMWTNRIEAAVANGDTRKAKEMMGKATYDKLLTTADKEKLDAKIKPQIKLSEAQEKVDAIFGKLVAANPNAPFPALAVDAELRKEFAGDPEGLRFARQEADYRASKIAVQQRESNHANLATVMQDIHERKVPPGQLYKSAAYQALDGDQKARVIQHLDQLATSAASRAAAYESRAAAAEARAIARREREGEAATLIYLANPEALAAMSPNTIAGPLAMEIGVGNARTLLNARAQLAKPGKLAQARMDVQTFKSIVADYGFDPNLMSGRAKTSADKEKQAELSTMFREVNQLIEARAQQTNRPVPREETEKIMRDAMNQKVKLDYGFLGLRTREVPRLLVPTEGERATEALRTARVDLKESPPDVLEEHIRYIRENRKGFERRSDAEIMRLLKEPLERAEGIRVLGGSPDLIRSILSGGAK